MVLAGCPCESFDCDSLNEIAESCKDPESNKNYQFCYDEQKNSVIQCWEKCVAYDCHVKCSEIFEEQLERCPCAPQCPCNIFFFLIYFSWRQIKLCFQLIVRARAMTVAQSKILKQAF